MKRLIALVVVAASLAAVGLFAASAHTQRTAALRVFRVVLAGENETPAGDPVATGSATIRARAGQARLCYRLAVRDLSGRALAAHVHRGAAAAAGAPVISLEKPDPAGQAAGRAQGEKGGGR